MTKKIKPLGDRVLVERAVEEEKTAGGIIIPDTAKEKPAEGKVIAVGTGTAEKPKLDVKIGDKILFGKWAGTEVKLDGKDYIVMKEEDIIAIIEN